MRALGALSFMCENVCVCKCTSVAKAMSQISHAMALSVSGWISRMHLFHVPIECSVARECFPTFLANESLRMRHFFVRSPLVLVFKWLVAEVAVKRGFHLMNGRVNSEIGWGWWNVWALSARKCPLHRCRITAMSFLMNNQRRSFLKRQIADIAKEWLLIGM